MIPNRALLTLLTFFMLTGIWISQAAAETGTSVELDLYNGILMNPEPDNIELRYLAGGSGKIRLEARGNRNVRGELSIAADLGLTYTLTIDTAYIRTRLGPLRLTAGKTRISWGEGTVFNAADVIMGSTDLNVDLTSTEFRSETDWLSALYLPLGRFSFIEAVVLPPMPDTQAYQDYMSGLISDPFPPISDTGLGVRSSFTFERFLGIKLETGYFYTGSADSHTGYLSLQGGTGLNWHLSSSLEMTGDSFGSGADAFFQGLKASGGLYSLNDVSSRVSMNVRMEALYDYSGEFIEVENPDPANPPEYGIYGYFDFSLGIDSNLNVYLRSIVSPADGSALVILGNTFNIYQGFTFYTNVSGSFGETNDTYANRRLGGYGLVTGIRYIY